MSFRSLIKGSLVLAGIVAWSVCAGAVEVRLTVTDAVGVARKAEHVTTGVCFKPGEVKDLAKLALFTESGKAVPAQFSPLVKLEDGSWQWVLVDFQGDAPANGSAVYVVKDGAAAKPANPVTASQADGVFHLSNGLLSVTVDAKAEIFDVISQLKVDGAGVMKGAGREALTCRDALDGNKLYHAGRPTKAVLEEVGPMRTALMLEGDYVDEAGVAWLGYRVRIAMHADSKRLRVEHILRNSDAKEVRLVKVKDAYLRLGLAGAAADKAADGKSFIVAGGVFAKHRLLSGYFSPGLHDLSVSGGKLVLGVVPTYEGGYEPKNHRGYNNQDKNKDGTLADYNPGDTGSWWMADCTYKTDEYWLDFAGGDENLDKALDSRLYALASARYYSECGALSFGEFGTLEDEVATYKVWGWSGIEESKGKLLNNKWIKALPEYHVASDLSHDETETDDAEGCLLMALRTGGRGYFDAGMAWARYYANNFVWRMDFPYTTKRGKGKAWKLVGRDSSNIVSWGYSYNNGRTCGCHFYGSGAMDYYVLTGDRELLAGCYDIAYYARKNWENKLPGKDRVGSWGTRGFGRQFMALVRMYEITRDPEWKAVMEHTAQLGLQDPEMKREGDWMAIHSPSSNGAEKKNVTKLIAKHERLQKYLEEKKLVWDEATSTMTAADGTKWEVYDMAGSWEQTYVQQGMDRYWRITGSKAAADYIVGFANFFRQFSWSPHCQYVGYRLWGVHFPEKGMCLGSQAAMWDPAHDTCPGPGASHSGWYTCFGPDVAARAYRISGDRKYLDQAKEYWNRGSKRGYQRKETSAADNETGSFAAHVPPKDDTILATALMFHLVPKGK